MQVHYAPAGPGGAGRARALPAADGEQREQQDRALLGAVRLHAGQAEDSERPAARAPPRGLPGLGRGLAWGAGAGDGLGATPSSRLPEEARYLASLPPAKAIAVRLDTRAGRERARDDNSKKPPQAAVTWSWPALAAVVIPALILVAVALV